MSGSTVEHFSHPKHSLRLKEDDVIEADATCSLCDKSFIGSPTYTCSSDDIGCQSFYLHKTCAELPTEIVRRNKDQHPLALLLRPDGYGCDICRRRPVKFAYACVDCDFDMCVICASVSEDRVISHAGHPEHTLTLLREASLNCDACWEEARDFSYVCLPCDFWIHKKCASSPPTIPAPTYHHHPLTLIFSVPVEHRYFSRYCAICKEIIWIPCWCYYCHKCTFFVHLKCSTSTISFENEIEDNDTVDNEPDLVQFPLAGEESLLDFIITQCSKFQVQIEGESENSVIISTMPSDPDIIEKHWSHRQHPLELRQFSVGVDDNKDEDSHDDEDGRKVLICDGCVQPITISHPRYYACNECGFFLHSFCANQLPLKLPAGASPSHPEHILYLRRYHRFYSFATCGICEYHTNGFFYNCETCDVRFDIRCVFLPTRIRHRAHKHHSLIQQGSSNRTTCCLSGMPITEGLLYTCETCSSFQVSILCAFCPNRMKHKYDNHSLILRHPLFFYEGVFYCQICEEQVNNQRWLYNCDECDQSFHNNCLRSYENVKQGGRMKHIIDNQPHTLALVLKKTTRKKSSPYLCAVCGYSSQNQFFFECEGCGYLACIFCIRRIHK